MLVRLQESNADGPVYTVDETISDKAVDIIVYILVYFLIIQVVNIDLVHS